MSRAALTEAVAAVQGYVRYLQRLGVTDLPVTFVPPIRAGTPTPQTLPSASRASPQVPSTTAAPAVRLAQLAAAVRDCRNCRLHTGRTQVVFGTGDPTAALVFVGEAPGYDEDIQGEPFVGQVKCRPPNNRNPQPDEVAACRPILQEQLACLQPRVICALGTFAAQTLLQTEEKISRLRGRFHMLGAIQVMPTYHPAFLLRNPQYKRAVWEDMQRIQGVLGLR